MAQAANENSLDDWNREIFLTNREWTAGVTFDVLTNHISRNEYLDRIRHARVAMLLPHYQDGSFILSEAMALDVPVCVPGVHSFAIMKRQHYWSSATLALS